MYLGKALLGKVSLYLSQHKIIYLETCAASEDSDHLVHLHSLISLNCLSEEQKSERLPLGTKNTLKNGNWRLSFIKP